MPTAREVIVRTLIGFKGVSFTGHDIDMIEAKVRQANAVDSAGFAYIVARNWSLDKLRRQAAHARAAEAQAIRDHEREQYERDLAQARSEYWQVVFMASAAPTAQTHEMFMNMARVLWLTVFENYSDAEVAAEFPGTTREVRSQWRRRCRLRLRPHCSAVLWQFLCHRMWQVNKALT